LRDALGRKETRTQAATTSKGNKPFSGKKKSIDQEGKGGFQEVRDSPRKSSSEENRGLNHANQERAGFTLRPGYWRKTRGRLQKGGTKKKLKFPLRKMSQGRRRLPQGERKPTLTPPQKGPGLAPRGGGGKNMKFGQEIGREVSGSFEKRIYSRERLGKSFL